MVNRQAKQNQSLRNSYVYAQNKAWDKPQLSQTIVLQGVTDVLQGVTEIPEFR